MSAKIYMQSLLVDSEPVHQSVDNSGTFTTTIYANSNASRRSVYTAPESQIVRTFSSVPVVFPTELINDYWELGNALSEMSEVSDPNEWGVEQPVYNAAQFFAAALMMNFFPAPRVFNHGPKSIVFNWESSTKNLYLTISANKLSVLISTPQRIERRAEISYSGLLDDGRLLGYLRAAQFEKSVQAASSATSDFLEYRLLPA